MEAPRLFPGQVHVWTASLQSAGEAWIDLDAELAVDERARADRFRTEQLRRRFVVGRALLRRLLAAYAPAGSAALQIGYGSNDKPYLVDAPDLRFNVSHADDAALYAIAPGRDVGIDIEATTREVDVVGVARQAFSPDERAALAALAPAERRSAFFRIWTRKEAYVKARGAGLSYPTRSFSVSHRGDDDALLDDEHEAQARERWRVVGLHAPAGFAAALCARGRGWTVQRFELSLPR
jgi:4'-phosphopantetheinyl transferase